MDELQRIKELAGLEFEDLEYKGPLSIKQKALLKRGYKLNKDGVPYWDSDGDRVSPFYQDELGPGWDKDSLDREADDIIPGTSAAFDKARTDPKSQYKSSMTTDFSGGGYTTTTRTNKGRKVKRFPGIKAKINTTTAKNPGEKLKTKNTFRGHL